MPALAAAETASPRAGQHGTPFATAEEGAVVFQQPDGSYMLAWREGAQERRAFRARVRSSFELNGGSSSIPLTVLYLHPGL